MGARCFTRFNARLISRIILLGGSFCGVLPLGCSRSAPEAVTIDGTVVQGRLTTICWLYQLHTDLRGRTPNDYDELRVFAETLPAAHGGPSGLAKPFLLGPRDKQEIVIRYGLALRPNPGRSASKQADGPVIAYEQGGSNRRRFVVYAGSSRVEEVDETRFKELVP